MKVKKLIMDTWFNKLVTMQNKVSNFFFVVLFNIEDPTIEK